MKKRKKISLKKPARSVKKNFNKNKEKILSQNYDHKSIESKWQKIWSKDKIYKTVTGNIAKNLVKQSSKSSKSKPYKSQKKFYVLDMFPYPSGEGLHVGHPKGYIATDIVSRMHRMKGYNVLHPMGFDAFGLPAENYAIKTKTNPMDSVKKNVARYKKQLEILGFDYDWSREVNTTDPKFYRWTQWIFARLFEKGLAYESFEPINWCPVDKTGLSNEDIEDGRCERCGSLVERKPMHQWVLKITDYAERLLRDLDATVPIDPKHPDGPRKPLLDWPESIKESQRNWIGRSEGVNIRSKVKDTDLTFEMYDSIPQTYAAQTFTVIAPDHPKLKELLKGLPAEQIKKVTDYAAKIVRAKAEAGYDHENNLDGIFTGRYTEFTPTGKLLPIWVASYVVSDYGTGIVNASAHDERDFAFAKKFNIPLHPVLFPKLIEHGDRANSDHINKIRRTEVFYREPDGILTEPSIFAGRAWGEVRQDVINHLVKNGWATRKVNYKIRDWVFARQRYWGEPFPIVYTENKKPMLVPDKELPVTLPKVKSYEPTGTGQSPLSAIKSWVNTTTKIGGKKVKVLRETDTMPQWAGSSWYYLRFMDPANRKALVDPKTEKYWNSIDLYVGGAEHATRHLIYARFWHKFLYDIGVVSTIEPFIKLQSVGLIMAEDGRKMSKRYGNVVNPDEIVKTYGADTLRVYEMFMGPFDQAISWSTKGILGSRRFLERVWKLRFKLAQNDQTITAEQMHNIETTLHKTIKKVTEDITSMRFNTAISSLMVYSNELEKLPSIKPKYYVAMIQLLAPFAPHITEEIWRSLSKDITQGKSIHTSSWPHFDQTKTVDQNATIIIQVNGRVRGEMQVPYDPSDLSDATQNQAIEEKAKNDPNVAKWILDKKILKVIVIKNRLVNIVVE